MNRNIFRSLLKKERGQAIILVAAGLVGLVAMVGLVIDTGILFIEYGKLKRGVDAGSIAAAQQYRSATGGTVLDQIALENAARNFMQLNQSRVVNITVNSCESAIVEDRPDQCNPDPIGNPIANRKLVEVTASEQVDFAFLRVIGINSTTITTTSVGEAAALDLVLIVDTSGSMAYETDISANNPLLMDPTEDPSVCNLAGAVLPCQPMTAVKAVANNFINTIYFPYDRVAIVPMTSQSPGGTRYLDPGDILPLTSDKATVVNKINDLTVFEPRRCADPFDSDTEAGDCLKYSDGGGPFERFACPIYENNPIEADRDASSCNSSNVGGALINAGAQLSNPSISRPESFWVVVAILGGPANATDIPEPPGAWPYGYCPEYTWLVSPKCRDRHPGQPPHGRLDTADYTNPFSGVVKADLAIFDADDFARESADTLATSTSTGVTIYTIGLGAQVASVNTSDDFYPVGTTPIAFPAMPAMPAGCELVPGTCIIPPAAYLLKYIAETAGGPDITHGQFFYAPTVTALTDIFEMIANNIATRISE